jgi:N6-L-threonylcarbamoyladenine synthase
VAAGPGLIGALLVGVSWARAAAFALGVPWIPVHHMEGHLFGPVLEDPEANPPFVALLVSGGHTLLLWVPEWGRYFLLGQTRDDAVGEAFDKVGKLLGLPYPGGPAVQAAAVAGDPARYAFPRPMMRPDPGSAGRIPLDFSFSGLKTAVAQAVMRLEENAGLDEERAHLAASFQEAVVDVLTRKTFAAMEVVGCDRLLLGGGVSANGPLRSRFREGLAARGRLFVGSPRVSLDNGAMIARTGQFRGESGRLGGLRDARASVPIPGMLPWTPETKH